MLKRFTLVCAACVAATAAALALGAGSARAGGSTLVGVLPCDGDGGSISVPAGDVTLRLGGYANGTLGLIQNVLLAQTTTLDVGNATYNLSNQWSTPVLSPFGFWLITQPNRDIGPLSAGQSVTVTYDIAFSNPVAVLFLPVGSSGDNGPFLSTGEGPFTCTISAT